MSGFDGECMGQAEAYSSLIFRVGSTNGLHSATHDTRSSNPKLDQSHILREPYSQSLRTVRSIMSGSVNITHGIFLTQRASGSLRTKSG